MEILQTIWTALTTENETLINLISIPFTFIEITLSMLLFTTILNINSSKKKNTFYVIIMSVISLLVNFITPNPYRSILNFILIPLIIYIVFKIGIKKIFRNV